MTSLVNKTLYCYQFCITSSPCAFIHLGFQYRSQYFAYTSAAYKTDWTLSLTKLRATEAEVCPFLAAVLQVSFFWTTPFPLWPDAQHSSHNVRSRVCESWLSTPRPIHQAGNLFTRHVRIGIEQKMRWCCLARTAVLRNCPTERQSNTWHCQAIPSVFHRL